MTDFVKGDRVDHKHVDSWRDGLVTRVYENYRTIKAVVDFGPKYPQTHCSVDRLRHSPSQGCPVPMDHQDQLRTWADDIYLSAINADARTNSDIHTQVELLDEHFDPASYNVFEMHWANGRELSGGQFSNSTLWDTLKKLLNLMHGPHFAQETRREARKADSENIVHRRAAYLAFLHFTARSLHIKTSPQPKEPEVMSKSIVLAITTTTFVTAPGYSNVDVASLSAEDLGSIVQSVENEVKALQELTTKPKAVVARIEELKAGLTSILEAADKAFDAAQ